MWLDFKKDKVCKKKIKENEKIGKKEGVYEREKLSAVEYLTKNELLVRKEFVSFTYIIEFHIFYNTCFWLLYYFITCNFSWPICGLKCPIWIASKFN